MATKCKDVQDWVEEQVWKPVDDWVEKAEEKCEEYDWWNPIGWFCWLVITIVKIIRWVLVPILTLVIRVVCEVVNFFVNVATGIVNLLIPSPSQYSVPSSKPLFERLPPSSAM